MGPISGQILHSILGNLLSAGLATALLLQTAGLGFAGRWLFVEGLALSAWLVGVYPMAVWWGTACGFVGYQLLDFAIGWGMAGLVLSWLVGDRQA